MPLPPSSLALATMRSIAWRRASSSRSVYSVTSPWRIDFQLALKFLAKPMLRTTSPKAMPRFSRITAPGSSWAVVMGSSKSVIRPSVRHPQRPMAFEDDIALTCAGEGRIADGWATPRGPHGGYVMALLAGAMERAVDDPARQARALTTHFLRPPRVGPVQVDATIERAGRSMSTLTARMQQDGKPIAIAIGAFSRAYDAPELGEVPMPAVAAPERTAEPLPGAPPFARRLALQPRFGDLPLSGSDQDEVGGWIDLPEAAALGGAALGVLADGYSPAIWPRLSEPYAAPTIDLTVHVRAPLPVEGPLLARFRSRLARDGFFEEDGELWTRDGTLVAQSRQLALLLM